MSSKISVCMTTYNGGLFVLEQVISILNQLDINDELIICDDGSNDETVRIIEAIDDKRINFHKNHRNLRHVKNFEKAIGLAKNDIIILSDQDDRWHEDKVKNIKIFFDNNISISYFHHNYNLMDENGVTYEKDANSVRLNFNELGFLKKYIQSFFKSHYYGSCIAFRRKELSTLLPFPDYAYAHDHWISICGLVNKSIYCSNLSLIDYRQHSNNVTPKGGLKISKKIAIRFKYLIMTFICVFRSKVKNNVQ